MGEKPPRKAMYITYALFGRSFGGSVFAEVFQAVIDVFLRKSCAELFGRSVRRKKPLNNNNVTGTVIGVSSNT